MANTILFLYGIIENRPNEAICLETYIARPSFLRGKKLVAIIKPSGLRNFTNGMIDYASKARILTKRAIRMRFTLFRINIDIVGMLEIISIVIDISKEINISAFFG